MSDPTRAEPRNASEGGETVQETADRMAGSEPRPTPPTPPSVTRDPVARVKPPVNVHPSAKNTWGAPVDPNPPLGQAK